MYKTLPPPPCSKTPLISEMCILDIKTICVNGVLEHGLGNDVLQTKPVAYLGAEKWGGAQTFFQKSENQKKKKKKKKKKKGQATRYCE